MPVTNRRVVEGVTVRFFFQRRDAINAANGRSRATYQQHECYKTKDGWLVRNVVTGQLFDTDGPLPNSTSLDIYQGR